MISPNEVTKYALANERKSEPWAMRSHYTKESRCYSLLLRAQESLKRDPLNESCQLVYRECWKNWCHWPISENDPERWFAEFQVRFCSRILFGQENWHPIRERLRESLLKFFLKKEKGLPYPSSKLLLQLYHYALDFGIVKDWLACVADPVRIAGYSESSPKEDADLLLFYLYHKPKKAVMGKFLDQAGYLYNKLLMKWDQDIPPTSEMIGRFSCLSLITGIYVSMEPFEAWMKMDLSETCFERVKFVLDFQKISEGKGFVRGKETIDLMIRTRSFSLIYDWYRLSGAKDDLMSIFFENRNVRYEPTDWLHHEDRQGFYFYDLVVARWMGYLYSSEGIDPKGLKISPELAKLSLDPFQAQLLSFVQMDPDLAKKGALRQLTRFQEGALDDQRLSLQREQCIHQPNNFSVFGTLSKCLNELFQERIHKDPQGAQELFFESVLYSEMEIPKMFLAKYPIRYEDRISQLPLEIFLEVTQYLSMADLNALQQVNRSFRDRMKNPLVWKQQFEGWKLPPISGKIALEQVTEAQQTIIRIQQKKKLLDQIEKPIEIRKIQKNEMEHSYEGALWSLPPNGKLVYCYRPRIDRRSQWSVEPYISGWFLGRNLLVESETEVILYRLPGNDEKSGPIKLKSWRVREVAFPRIEQQYQQQIPVIDRRKGVLQFYDGQTAELVAEGKIESISSEQRVLFNEKYCILRDPNGQLSNLYRIQGKELQYLGGYHPFEGSGWKLFRQFLFTINKDYYTPQGGSLCRFDLDSISRGRYLPRKRVFFQSDCYLVSRIHTTGMELILLNGNRPMRVSQDGNHWETLPFYNGMPDGDQQIQVWADPFVMRLFTINSLFHNQFVLINRSFPAAIVYSLPKGKVHGISDLRELVITNVEDDTLQLTHRYVMD